MGVIGAGLGVHKAQIIKDSGCWYGFPYGDMNGISGTCIGWWDASDVSTLYQNVSGTTPVSAAGQAVHRIKNKAISTDKLGEFLVVRSPSSSPAAIPQYKEGGLNENSYLEIQANSKGYYSSKAAGAGGVTDGSVFSNATVNNQAFTTFTVIRSGTQTGSTTLDKPAFVADGKTSGTINEVHETIIADTTNQKWTTKVGIDAGATTSDIQSTLTGADEFEGILITNVNSTGATSRLRINQAYTEEVYGTIAKQADFVMADGRVTICGHCQDDTCSAMEQGFNPGAQWYEQIVFNVKLTEEQIKCVEDYLMAKYNILPVMSDLVGWWDFSNVTTLYQSVGNYTSAITADGQTIGTVQNLALGDSNGDKLGNFLRAWSNDAEFKPVYKTGGQNAKSYAQFNTTSDTTNQKRMLFAGGMLGSSDFTTTGGQTATLFSNLVLNNQAQTIFVVWKNDLNDYNQNQDFIGVTGHAVASTSTYSYIRNFRNNSEQNALYLSTGTNPIGEFVPSLTSPTVPHNDADHHFYTVKLNNGTNQSFVKTDFVTEGVSTTTGQVVDFDANLQDGNGHPSVQLGGWNNNAQYNTDLTPWVGRIYEVLYYSRALTPTEISGVENYLAVKYAPGPQTFIVNELVGWWDFTDNESMFQTNAGATAVMANNDPIGRIMNKADGDLLGNKLGEFLNAYSNTATYRPTFKTGGINGLTYAEFGLGSQTGLRGGFFNDSNPATDHGGVSATKFSDLKMNLDGQTVYLICERTGSAAPTQSIYMLTGHADVDTETSIYNLGKTNATNQLYFSALEFDGGGIITETIGDDSFPAAGTLCIAQYIGSPGWGTLIVNGEFGDNEAIEQNIECDLSKNAAGTTGYPSVTIGNSITTNGETGSAEWIGKIYEVFVFNKTLSSTEIGIMNNYITTKYGQVGNVMPIADPVGHWDFTDNTYLKQTIAGVSNVTSDGDRIGRVVNIASGDENGYKLGSYLNAPANTNVRPTYKTGGINGHTYAKFNEGGDASCLRAGNFSGTDANNTGGVSAEVFSNLQYNTSNRTVFIMFQPDNANAAANEFLYKVNGRYVADDTMYRRERIYRNGPGAYPNKMSYYRIDGTGINYPIFESYGVPSTNQVNTSPTYLAHRNTYVNPITPSLNEMWLNTNQQISQPGWAANPINIDLDYGTTSGAVTSNRPYVTIGTEVDYEGTVYAGNQFDGDIYEIIVFNRSLTDTEMSQMNTYFQTKYNIDSTVSLPVISDHVGHWDFSDASTMKQNRNNTTAVTADGDPIGRINNLAPGDASGDKLGAFLRSGADDATRPTYKTDGINGKSYAKFDPAGGGQLLRTGFFNTAACNDDGGETATKFSDLKFDVLQSTMFFVFKSDDVSSSDGQRLYTLLGVENGDSIPAPMVSLYRKANGSSNTQSIMANSGTFYESNTFNTSVPLGTNASLDTIKNTSNNVYIYRDGTFLVSGAPGSGWSNESKMALDINNNGATQKFDVGSLSLSNGTRNPATTDPFEGEIYEILIYNKVLSFSEIAEVEGYISGKYGITIS